MCLTPVLQTEKIVVIEGAARLALETKPGQILELAPGNFVEIIRTVSEILHDVDVEGVLTPVFYKMTPEHLDSIIRGVVKVPVLGADFFVRNQSLYLSGILKSQHAFSNLRPRSQISARGLKSQTAFSNLSTRSDISARGLKSQP